MLSDLDIMRSAIDQARLAAAAGEVPVGAVIVDDKGMVIAAGHNLTITNCDPTAHAEVLAIRTAAAAIGNYRLNGLSLFTTIEPCIMCAGTIVNSRLDRVVYGATDKRYGAVETLYRICSDERLNHRPEVIGGILAEECASLMTDFFRARR